MCRASSPSQKSGFVRGPKKSSALVTLSKLKRIRPAFSIRQLNCLQSGNPRGIADAPAPAPLAHTRRHHASAPPCSLIVPFWASPRATHCVCPRLNCLGDTPSRTRPLARTMPFRETRTPSPPIVALRPSNRQTQPDLQIYPAQPEDARLPRAPARAQEVRDEEPARQAGPWHASTHTRLPRARARQL